jgi:para-nitrobenzyl esterase
MKNTRLLLSALLAGSLSATLLTPVWAQPAQAPAAQVKQKAQQQKADVSAYHQGVLQDTQYGYVQGVQVDKALVWKGVPYGTAQRWKAPEDPVSWKGILKTDKPGPRGIQGTAGNTQGVEDCLNLDIYRPNTKENGLPVLFFIHGGNNQTGLAQLPYMQHFAESANVVVISINHRLGALGFNPLPALKHGTPQENSGNFAVLDMIQGLDWTKENIANFGGDPNNITISGFSSGGRDVMALLISPAAKGKFQKALSFSGGMTTSKPAWAQKIFAQHFAPLAVADGMKKNTKEAAKWLLQDKPEVAAYLNGLSADRVAGAFGGAAIRMEAFPHLYTDGVVLPKDGFATKSYNQVPLVMVTGTDEFSLFMKGDPYFASAIKDKTIFTDPVKHQEYAFANKYGGKLYGLFNAEESAEIMKSAYGDAPIYTMSIAYGNNPELVGKESAFLLGSVHGIWIPFVTELATNSVASYPKNAFSNPGALALRKDIQQYLGNFMRTGNPNGKNLPQWQQWTDTTNGPSSLIVNATKDKAVIDQSHTHTTIKEVLDEMAADQTLTNAQKKTLIQQVMNGRWFSSQMDARFKNMK